MYKRFVIVVSVFVLGFVTVVAATDNVFRTVLSLHQIDKKTEISANLRQAKYMMDNNNYSGAKKKLDRVLELDPSNAEANNLIVECKIKVEQIRKKEKAAFQDACKKNTISALRIFIDEHPNSEFRKDAEERIKDFELWYTAKEKNTIDSYNLYLQKSSVMAYKEEAQVAIKKIQADQAWDLCKNTADEKLLNNFIVDYPESPHIEEAKYKLNLLKGERLYREGFTDMAFSYLSDANSYRTLTGDAAVHYKELKDKKSFNEIMASSDTGKVKSYLNTLSFSSPYYNDTSNHLALLLGSRLSAWSSEDNMNEALAYAKDGATRDAVKKYISQAKDLHKKYERERRALARKRWWEGRVSFGWNIVNVGVNIDGNDQTQAHIGTGLRLRFGRYTDILNIILGADYQYYKIQYDDYRSNDLAVHQGNGIANLRFNLCRAFTYSSFYIGCAGDFAFYTSCDEVSDEYLNKSTIAVEPQIGIQGRKWDFGLYYRTFTDKNSFFKYKVASNNHIGTYFTWYF